MSMIFGGGTQGPTRLNSVKITQSCLGLPFTTVMGTGKVQQQLLWLDGFSSVPAPSGGKGGGKGASGYIYSADAIVALCNGPILAVRDFWSDQSWIGNTSTSENYTIASPGIYTPQQASTFVSDQGVSVPNAYSQAFTDLNAPGANNLLGTDNTPMTLVPYGSPLNQGEYSILSGNCSNSLPMHSMPSQIERTRSIITTSRPIGPWWARQRKSQDNRKRKWR